MAGINHLCLFAGLFATALFLSSLCTLQSCIKSLQQDNTKDKTSKCYRFAATVAGFIPRFTMCLLYLCFYDFTYLCAFYCCREIDFLLGNAFHQRHHVDKISFELVGLKNNSISEKIAEISTFNSKPNTPYRHNIPNIPWTVTFHERHSWILNPPSL